MVMVEQNEERLVELLAGIAQKRHEDFELFYRITVAKVLSFAHRVLGEQHAAEDCAAEVFLQVWKNASHYSQERGTPSAWLMVMCRTRAIDRLRRSKKSALSTVPRGKEGDDFEFETLTPEAVLEAFQGETKLYLALEKLNSMQQQMIGLAFFKGLSHAEIASRTGLPLGTVKSNIRRGLISIRESLQLDRTQLEGMSYGTLAKA
jgi:RNA polymerase sigma-70 factor, ECF subfamily